MRYALAALVLSIATMPASADDAALAAIKGPAARTILAYLRSERVDCPSDADRRCTLASTALAAKVFYGHFPGDEKTTAVVFLDQDSGGSGASLSAMVWQDAGPRGYRLKGKTAAVGDDARDVSFLPDNSISYLGTVIRSGDSHATPSGSERFRLVLTGNGIRVLSR